MSTTDKRLGILFVIPSLLVLLVIVGWPVVYSGFMSVSNITIAKTLKFDFIGLGNYLKLFNDPKFHLAVLQTVVYVLAYVGSAIGIGLAMATLLNRGVGVRVLKYVFLVPWALSPVVNAVIWGWIFNGMYGILNFLLLNLGFIDKYHVWLAEPKFALAAVITAAVWKGVPFVALMLLAALQNVPRELMDAAKVDGAGVVARFTRITLPLIRPSILVLLVIETMWALKSFDLVWVLTQGGPVNRTMLVSVFAYEQSFRFFKFGYGAASSYIITFGILLLTFAYTKVLHGFED